MGEKKQTALNLTTSLLAFVVNAGINFFLTPYMIKKLGTESYGFIGLANDIVNYANILSMALNTMSSRFVSVEYHRGNKEKAQTYINSILVANLILAGAVAFAGVIVVWKLEYLINIPDYLMSDVKITFALVFINYLLSIIIAIMNCAPFIKNKMNLVYTRNLISYILKLIITIALITVFDIKIFFISLTTLLCTTYLAAANAIIFKKLLPEIKLTIKGFRVSAVKEILSSGIWMSLLSLSNLLLSGLNSLLTNRFISAVATGYLSVARSIPSYIGQLGQQLGTVFAPSFTKLYAEGKKEELIIQAKKSMRLMGLIMTVPVAGFMAFGYEFYHLWVENYASDEVKTVQTLSIIITLPYLFNAHVYPLTQINTALNKLKIPILVTAGIGFLNILIVFILGATNHLTLITLTLSSYIMMSIRQAFFQPWYAAHILKIKHNTFFKTLLRNFVIFLLIFALFHFMKPIFTYNSWFSFILHIAIFGIIGYIITFFLIFNKNEYKEMFNLFTNKLKKNKE